MSAYLTLSRPRQRRVVLINSGASITSNSINSTQIANGSILGTDISNDTITSANIRDGSILTADICDNAITFDKLAFNSVGNTRIINAAVTHEKLSGNCIQSHNIVDGTIVDGDISANANILGSKLANNSITSDKINQANNWTFSQLTSTTANIRDISTTNIEVSGNIVPLRDMSSNLGSSLKRWNKVFVDDLSVNTINGQAYTGSGGGTLAPNSINSSHIVNNSITNDDIAPLTITGAKIAENTINFSKFDTATNNILNSLALRLTALENNALIMSSDTIINGTQGNTITIPIDLSNNESVTINFTFKLSGSSNDSVYIKYINNGGVNNFGEMRATTITFPGNTYVFTIKVYRLLPATFTHISQIRYVMEGEGSYCVANEGNSRVEFNGLSNVIPHAIYITHGTSTTMDARYSIINNKG